MKVEITTAKGDNIVFSHADNQSEIDSVERIVDQILELKTPGVKLAVSEDRGEELYVGLRKGEIHQTDEKIRAFLIGYYVDEDGLATTKSGKSLGEKIPGQFLRENREKLIWYDNIDEENGKSFLPLYDQEVGVIAKKVYPENVECIRALLRYEMRYGGNVGFNNLCAIMTDVSAGNATEFDWRQFAYDVSKFVLKTQGKYGYFFNIPIYAQQIATRRIHDYEDWVKLALSVIDYKVGTNEDLEYIALGMSDCDVAVIDCILDPQNWETIFRSGDLEVIKKELIKPAASKMKKLVEASHESSDAWVKLAATIEKCLRCL